LAHGDFPAAQRVMALAAALDPQHPRTVLLGQRVADALKQQAAAEAAERRRRNVAELLSAATAHLQSADANAEGLSSAMQKITQALALDPENADARTLETAIEKAIAADREVTRVKALVNDSRARFARGDHEAAIRLLENVAG